ncbi:hypothetical protein HanXRQr2_Chr13g0567891 [Helianthus annuus]|uniref:Uncharacterized protein n=1 Tax=Helianthus annuus TaxID=4232 RepID=A0A251SPF0_HELAN|nr:hypothetical protein HanXRQr2_Chr13g0567891 [Helianthus annuus]KAJ0496231.1 hypothetical protein HanHA89_Chr13g0497351 [Helianthus annuus]
MAYIWHLCELNSQVSSNSMVMNDVCQTALYVARDDGYSNVVHAIEIDFDISKNRPDPITYDAQEDWLSNLMTILTVRFNR